VLRIRSSLTAACLTVLLPLVGLAAAPAPAEAARSSDVRFSSGPGTGAPTDEVGGVPVHALGADPRPVGENVSTIGPVAASPSVNHVRMGQGWTTWSHGYTGDVYQTTRPESGPEGVTLTLPARTSAVYFYAEPDQWAEISIEATTKDGTTSSDQLVQGEGGARYFGFYSTKPFSSFITSITVSSEEAFAIGELAIGSDLSRYAALGDSYSSGEGGTRPTPETDTLANHCHRDVDAYPVRLSRDDKDLRPLGFAACSGAVTRDLTHDNHLFPSEPPQLDTLSSLTTSVTLTIGGNDVGFSAVLDACLQARGHADGRGCSTRSSLTGAVDARLSALAGQVGAPTPGASPVTPVTEVLSQIHARSPEARIYLAAYPELFGSSRGDFTKDGSSPSGRVCRVNQVADASLDYQDARWINRRTKDLNAVLKQAVKEAKVADSSLRATFVTVPTFDDHGLCDKKKAWINPLVLLVTPTTEGVAPDPVSFHPTRTGQKKGYYRAFQRHGL